MRAFTFVVPLVLCLVGTLQAAEPVVEEGRVTAVTVYQGQALVTREVKLPETEGLLEIVVTNLPESVVAGSLFAEPSEGAQVRSVRFRTRPIEEDVRKEVRELDVQIQAIQDKLAAVAPEQGLLNQRKEYLGQLERFSADTSRKELESGVLNAETLQKLTEFLFAERERIGKRELELGIEQRENNKQLELLNRKRQTVAAGSARTVREAVVFINAPKARAAELRLSYLVNNASWSPSYNVRATDARDQIVLEYNASIQQMSGEDWNDVKMVLSTATPSLVAKAPRLEALAIKLGAVQQPQQQDGLSVAENYRQLWADKAQLEKQRAVASGQAVPESAAGTPAAGALTDMARREQVLGRSVGSWSFDGANTAQADLGLNQLACAWQLLEFNNSLSELRVKGDKPRETAEGVSVSYELANRTSLPSRSDHQLIQISATPLKGEFYRLATPVLTSYVYEEARATNTSEHVFLAGPVATFLGGQFVGRGEIPTVTVGESFTVGLGIDSSLRAERELVDKEERIQGGNRVADFTYELRLENFGDEPANVRLLDRLPTVGENDIKVTLLKSDEKVSEEESYKMKDRKDGILRWDVEVPAGAVGTKRKVLRYTMQVEYDKQLQIVGMKAGG